MSKPVVSVIIPTHERAQYAVPTIRSMLALQGDIEVVVCDTSTNDLISSALHGAPNLARLKLVRPGRALSVVDNFNTALAAASGKYLTFIGDDDFVSAQILSVANWAEANKVDAIKFSFPTLYFWPDFRHKTQNAKIAGTLRTSQFSGRVTPHDAKAAALQAMANFGGGVMEMPRAYAGLISRELVERIEKKYGLLFGGVSPDIYSAFLISQETEKCVYIDYPVIIPGASGASTAGQSANGRHVGALRDNAHISPFHDLVWDSRIPEFYSVPTVWSYSLLKAVEKHGTQLNQINFPRLYLKCLIFHRHFFNETRSAISIYKKQVNVISIIYSTVSAAFEEATWIIKNIAHRLMKKVDINYSQKVQPDLADTLAASCAMQKELTNHPTTLNLG